ncbi:hypothetical protein KCU59_g9506, partial [Aureobasidium melanogenum]
DGSGPRSFINQPGSGEVRFDKAGERRDPEKHHRSHGDTHYDVVDYLFPKDNPMDTSPTNEKGVDQELRGGQLDLRSAEIEEAYRVINIINSGKGEEIAAQNMRQEGYKASSTHGLDGIDWASWTGRVNTQYVIAAGHSFGAATVVDMLRHEKRFHWVAQGIIYDIWGSGTRPAAEEDQKIQAPLLAINSEAFTYWPSNFDLVSNLVEEAHPCPAWLLTVRATIHVSQSDFSLLYPNVCSILLKASANPERALDINVNASLEFLHMVMPSIPSRIKKAFPNEELLLKETHHLEDIAQVDMHKPKDEKWMAARLRIPHEFTWRVAPGLARKLARKRISEGGGSPDDEIWLHCKPVEGTVEKYNSTLDKRKAKDPKDPKAAPGFGGCNSIDVECICKNREFLDNLGCCMSKACDKADQDAAIGFANNFCSAYKVTDLPTAATCMSTNAATTTDKNTTPAPTLDPSSATSLLPALSSAASAAIANVSNSTNMTGYISTQRVTVTATITASSTGQAPRVAAEVTGWAWGIGAMLAGAAAVVV